MNFRKLITYLTMGTAAAMPLAVAQNPTILQGSYISNVFGNSNFIKNPNAQTNIADVTVSNATVTRSTTTPLVATSEFLVTVTSANGTIAWNTRTFDQGMKGQNCEARFTYRGFQSTSVAQVRQGATVAGANVVARLALTASTDPRIASINFPCGDLSQPTYFVITDTATLSGTHEIGGAYIGLATNMANVAQAETVVNAVMAANQTIAFSGTVIWGTEQLDVYNEFDPTTGIFTAKRAGNYQVEAQVLYDTASWTAAWVHDLGVYFNGVRRGGSRITVEATNTEYAYNYAFVTYSLNAGEQIDVRANISGPGITSKTLLAGTDFQRLTIKRFPSSSELVVKPETQSWFIDGYHTGNNPSLGTTAVATRTEITNGTMTFTPKTGSAPVATLCSSTNSPPALSTATTSCAAGNESMGITFNIPTAGIYKVCSEFQPNINVAAASEVDLYMFLEETATNANTALTTNRSVNRYFTATSTANNMTTPIRMCENFNFASVGQKAIRLMYQQTVAGTVNSAVIVADNYKERGIKWTVEPYDNQSNSALYVQGPILGAQTGAAISAGYQGETYANNSSVDNFAGLATYASLTLNPGVWTIFAKASAIDSAGTSGVTVDGACIITTNSAADPTSYYTAWLNQGDYFGFGGTSASSGSTALRQGNGSNMTVFALTSQQTVYLRCRLTYGSGTYAGRGSLRAVRLN